VHVIGRLAASVAVIALVPLALLARQIATQPPDGMSRGRAVFDRACSTCHLGDDLRVPSLDELRGRSPEAILDALTSGAMKYQGLALGGDERRAVAEYITGRKLRGTLTRTTVGSCGKRPPLADPFAGPLWNGWGPTIENTHFQPAAAARLTSAQVPRLRLKWAFGFPDTTSAWAQATIAGGRLFVGSQNGNV
jgi:polyvinyl alcohol dehydrogenase (cytochrome)